MIRRNSKRSSSYIIRESVLVNGFHSRLLRLARARWDPWTDEDGTDIAGTVGKVE